MGIEDLFSANSKLYNLHNRLISKPWKYLYKNLIPRKLRKEIEYFVDLSQQEYVADCWRETIKLYFSDYFNVIKIRPKITMSNQNIIWQYWGQGWDDKSLPDIVKLSTLSIDHYKGKYKIIRLDDNNLRDYLDIPEFILEKKSKNIQFKAAFFSDLLRLALLKFYGGIWLDATVLLTDEIEMQTFIPTNKYFMFQRSTKKEEIECWSKLNKKYFSWNQKHKVNVLNSIILSEKNNYLISVMLDLILIYWKTQRNVPHYFFFQILYDVLVREFLSNERCMIIDDTLPHLLYLNFDEPFDQDRFNEIKKQCNIHKLTYVKKCIPNSFYDHLRKEYNL